jgi:hypothetical protein
MTLNSIMLNVWVLMIAVILMHNCIVVLTFHCLRRSCCRVLAITAFQ